MCSFVSSSAHLCNQAILRARGSPLEPSQSNVQSSNPPYCRSCRNVAFGTPGGVFAKVSTVYMYSEAVLRTWIVAGWIGRGPIHPHAMVNGGCRKFDVLIFSGQALN